MAAIRPASDRGEHVIAWRLPVTLWGSLPQRASEGVDERLTIGLASVRNIQDRRGEAWTLHSLSKTHPDLERGTKRHGSSGRH